MDKKQLRRLLLEKRRSLLSNEKLEKEAVIHKQVLEISKTYQHIGLYVSLEDEVETKSLICQLLAQRKQVYVPRCTGNTLTFHQIQSLSELAVSRYGLLEPENEPSDISKIEILFVPLVGYDDKNNRLGYGKGYYDSILNQMNCLKIGLAFQLQHAALIPVEVHDAALDQIITE